MVEYILVQLPLRKSAKHAGAMVRRGRWPPPRTTGWTTPKTPTRSYAAVVPGTAPVTPTVDGDDGAGVDVDHGECDCDECDDSPDRDASDLAFFRQVAPRKRGRCGVDSHASECVRGCGVGAAEAVAAAIVALSRVELDADDDIKDNVSPDRGKKNMVRKNGNSDKRGSILYGYWHVRPIGIPCVGMPWRLRGSHPQVRRRVALGDLLRGGIRREIQLRSSPLRLQMLQREIMDQLRHSLQRSFARRWILPLPRPCPRL